MLATVKGYYDGSHIILNSPVQFQRGQEVIVTYSLVAPSQKSNEQLSLVDSLIGAIPDIGKSLEEYRS